MTIYNTSLNEYDIAGRKKKHKRKKKKAYQCLAFDDGNGADNAYYEGDEIFKLP